MENSRENVNVSFSDDSVKKLREMGFEFNGSECWFDCGKFCATIRLSPRGRIFTVTDDEGDEFFLSIADFISEYEKQK